ncbi:MAG TPA: hypothetical protein VN793_02730, partial [Acidimicrobiales bacterium]|nr:hypothetical protein [Acidimicrobiales bacterium]
MRLLRGTQGRLRVRKPAALIGAMLLLGLVALAPIDSGVASGQTTLISDSFANSTTSSNVTYQSNGAHFDEPILPCLTAGILTSGTSTIPPCDLATPAADGSGALRLTDENPFGEASDVIYNNSFPTADGLDITFDVHMYGGLVGPPYADGISFDLAALRPPPRVGQSGGALGYSTDGSGNPGMPGGYLGIGLDEYGNYSTTTYEDPTCDSSGLGFTPGQDANELTVHGPGNGTTGYCLLNSTLAAGAGDPMGASGIQLHGGNFTSSDIKVEIKIDTVTVPSSPTYSVTLTPASTGVTTPVVSGPLPTFYYDPATGHQVSGIPPQLSFAIAGSDGANSDIHEIDNVVANTISSNALTTLDLSMTDNGTGPMPNSVGLGEPYMYKLTPSVASGSLASETEPVTVIDQLPAGQSILNTAPYSGPSGGLDWDCSATNYTTNTVECTYTGGGSFPTSTSYPDITVPFAVTSAPSPNQPPATVTNTATASSSDSLGFASATDTVTLTATNPLLDATVSDSDSQMVPVGSPAFTLTMSSTLDQYGASETDQPTLSSTLPSDLEVTGLPSGGADWDCAASSGQTVSCTYTGAPVDPGQP